MSDYSREAFERLSGVEPDNSRLAWDGTGLPPVGTACEVFRCNSWTRAEIIAHSKNASGNIDAIYSFHNSDENHDWNWECESCKFRPIRTPEQIAAEVREKAVNEMADAVGFGPSSFIPALYALYDAGYRKIEN